jgi:hypothetical protein
VANSPSKVAAGSPGMIRIKVNEISITDMLTKIALAALLNIRLFKRVLSM